MKRKSFFTLFLVLVFPMCFFACGKKGNVNVDKITLSVGATEEYVAIFVEEDAVGDNVTVLTVMNALKEAGKLSYVEAGGMITEINGKKNAASFNPCWMLYTSDTEMANTEWGTYTYAETTLGSAILGADVLTVKGGETYVWVYQGF